MGNFLFGFVTTRNPSTIDDAERTRFHVIMDEQDRQLTRLWSNLRQNSFVELRREIVTRVRSGAFDPPDLRDLRLAHQNHIQLYREVNGEHNRGSLSNLPEFISDLAINPLTQQERTRLWDAMAFYLWADPQKEEIDTITAIFVADKILSEVRVATAGDQTLSEEELVILRRIAQARIVLPLRIDNRLRSSPSPRLSARQRRMLLAAHDQIITRGRIAELESAREDLTLAVARFEGARRSEDARLATLSARLTERLPAESASAVNAELASALTLTPPTRISAEAISTSLTSAIARRFLATPVAVQSGPTSALNMISAEIDDAQDNLDAEILVAASSTVLAFGAEFTIEERIPPGAMAIKLHRDEENGFNVFLTYHHGVERAPLGAVSGTLQWGSQTLPVMAQPVSEEEEAFQTFRLNERSVESGFVEVSLTLMTLAPQSPPVSLDPIRLFASQPHTQIADLIIDEGEEVDPPPVLFGITRLGMIEYRRIEQELSCYVTGEIARIENILASEYKERVSRSLAAIETEQEVTQEVASEYQTDTSTTESQQMQAEISQVLREERQKTYDVGVSVTAGLQGIGEMSSDFGFHHNTLKSREESTSEAIEIAKSVTRKVQERLTQKSTSRRRSLSRREFEDINKHGFDNRQNPEHVVGVYRSVDKIYTHRLVNEGEREMLEVVIPEPARAFIFAQQQAQEAEESISIRRPKRPRVIGLRRPASIKPTTWRRFAAAYGVDLDPPPLRSIVLSRAFGETIGGSPVTDEEEGEATISGQARGSAYNEIEVPEGYVATGAHVRWSGRDSPGGGIGSLAVFVADAEGIGGITSGDEEIELGRIAEIVPVAVTASALESYAVTVTITCERRRFIYRDWQMQSYSALMTAYRSQKDAYDDARRKQQEEQEELDLNPRFKRLHMERELKRICIEMLTNRFGVEVSANHYEQSDEDEFPVLRQSLQLERHALIVKFFEQAFDWAIMSYVFYPYFYGPKQGWSVKLSLEATRNQLFSSFLSSGMARLMLPVRRGMEDAVNYYLDTGQVWFGNGIVLDAKNDLYLSIADELTAANGRQQVIEETWQTRLPTNHTILQSASSALIEDGLPCDEEENRIGQGSSRLDPVLPLRPVDPE